MKHFALAIIFALAAPVATAGIVFNYETGKQLYVRFDDSSNTAVNLTEGSTLKAGRYTAADAAIDTAGLAAGTYTGRIFIGTAGAQSSGDVLVGVVNDFTFGASTQTSSDARLVAAMFGTSTADSGSGTLGRAFHYLLSSFVSNGKFSQNALSNAPTGDGEAIVDETAADLIAARVNASRGDFYPNAKQVWVLKRDGAGLEVKNDFQITMGEGETLKVWIDFASVVGKNEFIQSIDSLELSGGSAVIVTDSSGILGNLVYLQVEGGSDGDATTVDFEVTTTAGQVITGSVCVFNVVE